MVKIERLKIKDVGMFGRKRKSGVHWVANIEGIKSCLFARSVKACDAQPKALYKSWFLSPLGLTLSSGGQLQDKAGGQRSSGEGFAGWPSLFHKWLGLIPGQFMDGFRIDLDSKMDRLKGYKLPSVVETSRCVRHNDFGIAWYVCIIGHWNIVANSTTGQVHKLHWSRLPDSLGRLYCPSCTC